MDYLLCIKDCIMTSSGVKAITTGERYEILEENEYDWRVEDDQGSKYHWFPKEKEYFIYLGATNSDLIFSKYKYK